MVLLGNMVAYLVFYLKKCCFGFAGSSLLQEVFLVAVSGLVIVVASLVTEHDLWSTGLVEAWGLSYSEACGIFQSRTCVPCISSQILNHWATREVHLFVMIR